jgi:hypothetical protein
LLRDFSELSPQDNAMPLGALLAFAGAVLKSLVGRQSEIGNGLTARSVSRFWIAAQAPYQDGFVD